MLLLETFLSPTYLNTIQTSCPWILRYLATAAILSRKVSAGGTTAVSSRVRNSIREIVKVIQTEEYQYQDPVTSFLKELYVEFDFEAAQRELTIAERVVGDDFFLGDFRDEFLDNARYLISEAYCRIHQRIDIAWVNLAYHLFRNLIYLQAISPSGLTCHKMRVKNGLSILFAKPGWAQTPR
jgi:translation initiation factor 3 subunit E